MEFGKQIERMGAASTKCDVLEASTLSTNSSISDLVTSRADKSIQEIRKSF